jgi:hypothetical protein
MSYKQKCILCIPCRNVEIYLDYIFNNIKNIKNIFDDFKVYFFYDESSDNTLTKLKIFKKTNNFVHILVNKDDLLEFRTHRIANARNKLLELVMVENPTYFIMMDCDNVCCFPINIDTIKYYLSLNTWDALSFNRKGLPHGFENYDIWALQFEPFIHHCHSYNGDLSVVHLIRRIITEKLNNLSKGELFECYSAFNGFAIYRTEKFVNCIYDGERQKYFSDNEINKMLLLLKNTYNLQVNINYDNVDKSHGGGKQNCEHIGFHISAIRNNKARIRISGDNVFENFK